MTAELRARLAARQAELITALYGGPPAEGLDARLVTLTSDSLARKRARAVARAWPALARALGPGLADQFTAFARITPPPEGGALADGLAFSQVITHQRRLPDDARIEGMLATSRVKLRHNRLVPRRGPRLAAVTTGRAAPPCDHRHLAAGRDAHCHARAAHTRAKFPARQAA